MPHVIVIAGPNGAGKSTAAPALLHGLLGIEHFVNADVIARGLSAFDPESVSIQAGRIMLGRLRDLASRNEDFAFETTLASRSFAPWIAGLRRQQGYELSLFYLWVPAPKFSVNRVARRVSEGGHFVPPDVVERRFYGGISNFFTLYRPIADEWKVFDNSRGGQPLYVVAEGERTDLPIVYDQDLWERIQEDGRR
ncbi:MAG: zeta toxin family protein, partial [Dehalococcoidia bacterium]